MEDCKKKSPLRCLNCKQEDCDLKKITMILKKLGLLKKYYTEKQIKEAITVNGKKYNKALYDFYNGKK